MATSIKVSDNIERLPANPFAFEVLNLVSKQRTNAKKAQVLREYNDPSLQTILIWNFETKLHHPPIVIRMTKIFINQ